MALPKITTLTPIVAMTVALCGCARSPESYETEPVKVGTSEGIVTCQLYLRDLVVWDRAIDRPDSMSVAEADEICRSLGERRKADGAVSPF